MKRADSSVSVSSDVWVAQYRLSGTSASHRSRKYRRSAPRLLSQNVTSLRCRHVQLEGIALRSRITWGIGRRRYGARIADNTQKEQANGQPRVASYPSGAVKSVSTRS